MACTDVRGNVPARCKLVLHLQRQQIRVIGATSGGVAIDQPAAVLHAELRALVGRVHGVERVDPSALTRVAVQIGASQRDRFETVESYRARSRRQKRVAKTTVEALIARLKYRLQRLRCGRHYD